MNALLRMGVVALFAGLLTLVVFGLRSKGFSCKEFWENICRGEKIQRMERAIKNRDEARLQAAQAYIHQRCSLTETMKCYRELDLEYDIEWLPLDLDKMRQAMRVDPKKRYCRLLKYDLALILRKRPEELADILRRLEKDYQQLQSGILQRPVRYSKPARSDSKGRPQNQPEASARAVLTGNISGHRIKFCATSMKVTGRFEPILLNFPSLNVSMALKKSRAVGI